MAAWGVEMERVLFEAVDGVGRGEGCLGRNLPRR